MAENEKEEAPSMARQALVSEWISRIKAAEKRYEKRFKKMRENIRIARFGCDPEQWDPEENYVAPLIGRHISLKVGTLYAKNPKAEAKLRERLEYTIWDGSSSTLQAAMQQVQAYGQAISAYQQMVQAPRLPAPAMAGVPMAAPMPVPPAPPLQAQALIQEIQQVQQRRQMLNRVGRTLEVLFGYFLDEQDIKAKVKDMVRRVCVTGVGYVKIGFQRAMEPRAETARQMADITSRMAYIKRLSEEKEEGELDESSAEAESLAIALEQLKKEPEIVVREGIVFDFPCSDQIIPDPACTSLYGFRDASWVARKHLMTADLIDEIYDYDVRGKGSAYRPDREIDLLSLTEANDEDCELYAVYEIWDKRTGTVLTVCEGCCDFLREPEDPPVFVEGFFPFIALAFNTVEDPDDIFPPSDVEMARPMQEEYNRSRNAIRQHRKHSLPKYVGRMGALDDEDIKNLAAAIPFSYTKLKLGQGEKIEDAVQIFKHPGIDPNLYESETVFADMVRTVGSVESSFGSVKASATATGQTIAANAQAAGLQTNIDDLDDWLSRLARACSGVLLTEMSVDVVRRIVGVGAVWPDFTRQEIAESLYLDIKAGSSGKPNAQADLQKWQTAAPLLMQIPGVQPEWLIRKMLEALDPGADLSDAFVPGNLSIMAINGLQQPGTGDPATDPNAQGMMGAQNAPMPPEQGGGQMFPQGPNQGQVAGQMGLNQ